jgi:hypothetical protein
MFRVVVDLYFDVDLGAAVQFSAQIHAAASASEARWQFIVQNFYAFENSVVVREYDGIQKVETDGGIFRTSEKVLDYAVEKTEKLALSQSLRRLVPSPRDQLLELGRREFIDILVAIQFAHRLTTSYSIKFADKKTRKAASTA